MLELLYSYLFSRIYACIFIFPFDIWYLKKYPRHFPNNDNRDKIFQSNISTKEDEGDKVVLNNFWFRSTSDGRVIENVGAKVAKVVCRQQNAIL